MSAKQDTLVIDPIYVIICDDIRVENNGKDIFIGVYSGDIVLSNMPTALNLAFWIDLKTEGVGERAVEFRIVLDPGEVQIAKVGATLVSPPDDNRGSFAFGGVNIQFQRPGAISIQFHHKGEPWREVARKNVIVRKASADTSELRAP